MYRYLEKIIMWMASIHTKILTLNDAREQQFTDKEPHFLVIGVLGLVMVFTIYPIFKALAKNGHIMTITWIYVFTLVLVITFAIEIGQGLSGTGVMEFSDMVSGIAGFLFMFVIFALVRGVYHCIKHLLNK